MGGEAQQSSNSRCPDSWLWALCLSAKWVVLWERPCELYVAGMRTSWDLVVVMRSLDAGPWPRKTSFVLLAAEVAGLPRPFPTPHSSLDPNLPCPSSRPR